MILTSTVLIVTNGLSLEVCKHFCSKSSFQAVAEESEQALQSIPVQITVHQHGLAKRSKNLY